MASATPDLRLVMERRVTCQKFENVVQKKRRTCIAVHLTILCLICINLHHPVKRLNLTVTHGFNSFDNLATFLAGPVQYSCNSSVLPAYSASWVVRSSAAHVSNTLPIPPTTPSPCDMTNNIHKPRSDTATATVNTWVSETA